MTMRFDLIAAGVLAPGIESIDRLIEIATRGVETVPLAIGTDLGTDIGSGLDMTRSDASRSTEGPITPMRELGSFWTARQPLPPFVSPPALALPGNERRRASAVARLVLACADQALAQRPELAAGVRLVFAADEGVGDVCQTMLEALAHGRPVSPLVFANSVHNAPSGYFSIAHGNRNPATSLSLGEQSFACGLLTAAAEAQVTGQPVLFVSYDSPMPMPLRSVLPISHPSATAWLIETPEAGTGGRSHAGGDPSGATDAGASSSETAHGANPASTLARRRRPLASFEAALVELQVRDGCEPFDVAPLRLPLDHRPPWLHTHWAPNSSALGIAALGLLATGGGVRDYSLGKQALRLRRLEEPSA